MFLCPAYHFISSSTEEAEFGGDDNKKKTLVVEKEKKIGKKTGKREKKICGDDHVNHTSQDATWELIRPPHSMLLQEEISSHPTLSVIMVTLGWRTTGKPRSLALAASIRKPICKAC